jgi:hypothetical protein
MPSSIAQRSTGSLRSKISSASIISSGVFHCSGYAFSGMCRQTSFSTTSWRMSRTIGATSAVRINSIRCSKIALR